MSRKQKHQHHRALSILDVIITTGGRFDMLEKCLDALYREAQDIPISIYIIDNASPQEERNQNEHLFGYRPELDAKSGIDDFKSKRLQQEIGFPASNNEGARMGRSPLIMFLNDDVELHEGAIRKVVDTFDDPTIGIVGIKLLFPPTSTSPIRPAGKVQHVGVALDIHGKAYHPLVAWSPTNEKTCKSRDVFAVTGACLSIRRNLFNKLGGFDPSYGMGTWEDVDICLRARQLQSRIYVNTNATGYHYVGATQEKKRVFYPLQQNEMIFLSKWQQSGLLIWDAITYF